MKKLLAQLIPKIYGKYFNLLAVFSKKGAAVKAFDVFCVVRKGRIQPLQMDYLQQAKHSVEAINGHDIQTYKWSGNKDTVLLLHGWESNTFRWRNLVAKLQAADFNVIAFDGPGHGYSSGTKMHVPMYAGCAQYIIDKHQPKAVIGHSVD